MIVREVTEQDLTQLLALYTHLHGNAMPAMDSPLDSLWQTILRDPNHHIVVGEKDGVLVSSCVLLVVPNLTHGQRPYALVENVITHPDYRSRGYALQILAHAKKLAAENRCYKIMLMTGSKQEATLGFYERAGYNAKDKTAFIQWLD